MMTRKEFLRTALQLTAAAVGTTALVACSSSSTPRQSTPDAPKPGTDAPKPGTDAPGSAIDAPKPIDAPAVKSCVDDGTDSTIGSNHGHVLVVSKDDVVAGADKTYHIMGTASHDHTVELTATDFATLQANNGVMTVSSTTASHSHSIMIVCA